MYKEKNHAVYTQCCISRCQTPPL